MFDLIRSWFSVKTEVSAIEAKIDRKLHTTKAAKQELQKSFARFESVQEKLLEDHKRYEREITSLEEALLAARDQIQTAKDITIPGLIASHDVLVARWEKETKVAVMQAVLMESAGER